MSTCFDPAIHIHPLTGCSVKILNAFVHGRHGAAERVGPRDDGLIFEDSDFHATDGVVSHAEPKCGNRIGDQNQTFRVDFVRKSR